MDYEFRIQLLEKETAHLREMQAIRGARQDTTDDRLTRIESILTDAATALRDLTAAQVATERNLQALIDALFHRPTNGHGEK